MNKKRILALILAAAMLLGLCPTFAADAEPQMHLVDVDFGASPDADYDGYIVKFRDDVVVPYSGDMDYIGFGMYTVDEGETAERLLNSGAVEFVEPNYRVELYDVTITDQWYTNGTMWQLNGDNGMRMPVAWNQGLNGSGVTVAVLDTGLYSAHYDFVNAGNGQSANILAGYNATNDGYTDTDGNAYGDVAGHGTMVTGIIAAAVNGYATVGAAYGCNILPVRVFDKDGAGYIKYIISGLNYLVDYNKNKAENDKVKVANMSLGAKALRSQLVSLETAVTKAVNNGIIVVAAVGNDGTAELSYPASYENVVGVGALDQNGSIASYSQKNESVWVAAPGSQITATARSQESFGTGSGTSFASPCVASLAAVAVQNARIGNHNLTPTEFMNLMRMTATDAGVDGYDYSYGWGKVHADTMLAGMTEKTVTLGNIVGSTVESEEVKYLPYQNTPVTLPADPTMTGYFFAGWYDNTEFTGSRITGFIPSDDATTSVDHSYYAKWIEDRTALEAVTLTVDGRDWAAEQSSVTPTIWTVYLPNGATLPTGTDCVEVVYDTTETNGLEKEITYHEAVDEDHPAYWTIAVTQDKGVEGNEHTTEYTLTVDTSLHAPTLADEQSETVSGTATPVSLDGKTAAGPYTADVSAWFADADNDPLSYTLGDFEMDGTPVDNIVGLSIGGSTLTYAPPAAAANGTRSFSVTASDARFDGLSVTVTVTVGALPVSTPVLSAANGSFDASADPATDIVIGFTHYDNTFALLNDSHGKTLVADTDYTLYTGPDVTDVTASTADAPSTPDTGEDVFPASVTLKTSYLTTLKNGANTITFNFTTGRDEPATKSVSYTLNVTNSTTDGHTWDAGVVTTEPTCTSTGVRTYTCSICNDTKTETIEQLEHMWSNEWTSDDTNHWHACANCDTKNDTSTHTFDEGVVTTAATCAAPGVRTYTCSVCSGTKIEEIEQLRHVLTDENVWLHDDTGHWHACDNCDTKVDFAAHAPGSNEVTTVPSTCDVAGSRSYTCETCEAAAVETLPTEPHDLKSEDWISDNTYHWKTCNNCETLVDKATHEWDEGVVTTAATTTTAGVRTFTCTVCAATKTTSIPATGGSSGGWTPSGGGSTGGSTGNSSSKTDKEESKPTEVKNDDGSVTKTETDKETGTVTVTTEYPDGATTVVETKKDGTVTTTVTDAADVVVELVEAPDTAPTVSVTLPEGVKEASVVVPVKDGDLVARDAETGKVIPLCIPTDGGIAVLVTGDSKYELVDNSVDYKDVADGAWYEDSVDFVSSRELFRGTGDDEFSPRLDMSRAMIFTVLSRIAGIEIPNGTDVWYSGVLEWAMGEGLTDGTRPTDSVTREELITLLWRWVGRPDVGRPEGFSDVDSISAWALRAVAWATKAGILNGRDDGTIDQLNTAPRAETAALFERFVTYLVTHPKTK